MVLSCKGICQKHKAAGNGTVGRYKNGQKRCSVCELFIVWLGLWCPCCGFKLRLKPKNSKYRMKLKEIRV